MEFPTPSEMSNGKLSSFLSAILYTGRMLGYENLAVDSAVGGKALAAVPAGARLAVCVLEADATQVGQARVARYREDGATTPPTAAEGMPVGDNGVFELTGDNIAAFKIIGVTAAKVHSLKVQYYGQA